ncbi:MAG: hypothetical protein HOW73_24140 [Polyangiaceae bacterium]|nr:hypothetical protein [Polyangiaceae bacterium]
MLELDRDHALVLFEWLARSDDEGSLPFVHRAEQVVLCQLEGQLEGSMSVQFSAEYNRIVTEARDRIVAANEEAPSSDPSDGHTK